MIVVVSRILLVGLVAAALAAGCSDPPKDPMTLEGNRLTVDNRTGRDWTGVEIWLNTHYRVTTASIPAGGRFQVNLDSFVAGFGQRFDFRRQQIVDLRLSAKEPDGRAVEIKKQFEATGLAGMLPGKRTQN
jgi:hypothetical protein